MGSQGLDAWSVVVAAVVVSAGLARLADLAVLVVLAVAILGPVVEPRPASDEQRELAFSVVGRIARWTCHALRLRHSAVRAAV